MTPEAAERFEWIVAWLSSSEPWSAPVDAVIHTHISVVFLVGDRAYKLKKPLDLGFLDFTTLEKRRHFCAEEVRLNRRYAPDVYLGVETIIRRDGKLELGGVDDTTVGEVMDWLVVMRRLPDEANLLSMLEHGELDEELARRVGKALARLQQKSKQTRVAREMASFRVVRENARENFRQTREHAPRIVPWKFWRRVNERTEELLKLLRSVIEERETLARDLHGDLRLEHVYLVDHQVTPIDCIEFTERFRGMDPVADLAFLWMDLAVRGERALADALFEAWLEASGDVGARVLLPFYAAYRSVVRAKVAGMQAFEPEVPEEQRRAAVERARRHWLFALDVLESPGNRPALVAVGGLPGTGKSTLALGLNARAGFSVIRSDVVRKDLVGLDLNEHPQTGYEQGLYSPENKERIYAICLERAREAVLRGERVLVDASFSKDRWRQMLVDTGRELGVRTVWLHLEAPANQVHGRLDARGEDPSDADWTVYQAASKHWEPTSPAVAAITERVDASISPEQTVEGGLEALRRRGLLDA